MRTIAAACVSLWISIVPAAAQLNRRRRQPPITVRQRRSSRVPAEKRQCPATRTLDCMPLSAASQQGFCKKDYLAWIKSHCPGVAVEIVY